MTIGETKRRLTSWFHQWRLPLRKFLAHEGVRSNDLDDIAQEVFLRLLRYERSELVENPQAYLFRMASNVAAEWALRARSRYPHQAQWLLELTAGSQPEETVACEVAQWQIARAINQLPPRQREVLRLHFGEGLAHEQIAQRIGTSKRVVKRQLVKSYARLRLELDADLMGELKHGRS
jgi:RNA polymerase sigma-70 factor (ECF subfamily)